MESPPFNKEYREIFKLGGRVPSMLCKAVHGILRRSVSARDVAQLVGVSRCFTPGASISATTRACILAAAETPGYQVNRLASGLIRDESGLVALIAAEIATPYRAKLIAALTRQLQAAGKLGC